MKNILSSWEEVRVELQSVNYLFYHFVDLMNPIISDKIPTAGVTFSKSGKTLDLIINLTFWDSLNIKQKVFVVAHELSHVFYNHGKRINEKKNVDHKTANICADLFVNEYLIDALDFEKEEVDGGFGFIWVEDFAHLKITKSNLDKYSFEDICDLLASEERTEVNGKSDSFDDHFGISSETVSEELEEFIQEEVEHLSEQGKLKNEDSKLIDKSSPGIAHAMGVGKFKRIKLRKRKKWETIIRKYLRRGDDEDEGWVHPNRRFALLNSSGLCLPGKAADEFIRKINIWFFQDCSGSCLNYIPFFQAAAKTFPGKRFNIIKHMFDTEVFKQDEGFFGGGTSFDCIEKYIQRTIKKEKIDYPDAVFVFTDLEASTPRLIKKYENRWYWFAFGECVVQKEKNTFVIRSTPWSAGVIKAFKNIFPLEEFVTREEAKQFEKKIDPRPLVKYK